MDNNDVTLDQQHMRDLEDRLRKRFPDVDSAHLHEMTIGEYQAFDSARVRDFVPVLAERNVVKRITAAPRS